MFAIKNSHKKASDFHVQGCECLDRTWNGRFGLVGATIFGPLYTIWHRRGHVVISGNHKKALQLHKIA